MTETASKADDTGRLCFLVAQHNCSCCKIANEHQRSNEEDDAIYFDKEEGSKLVIIVISLTCQPRWSILVNQVSNSSPKLKEGNNRNGRIEKLINLLSLVHD